MISSQFRILDLLFKSDIKVGISGPKGDVSHWKCVVANTNFTCNKTYMVIKWIDCVCLLINQVTETNQFLFIHFSYLTYPLLIPITHPSF